jgi:hypothetical protein
MIIVSHHKGRSGLSVYEWRVYRVTQDNARTRKFQLGKFRTKESAERAAAHYRNNDARIAAIKQERI